MMNMTKRLTVVLCAFALSQLATLVIAQDWSLSKNPELAAYFENEVSKIEQQNDLSQFTSLTDWETAKPELRSQLFSMLSLDPLPNKTPLNAEITGTVEEEEFIVEKIHFQSMPGLYVTGNFYLPKKVEGPLPTVLYVCGHAKVVKDNVSLGNKTAYQHHGAWFARNGYACLIIDTLQLGEIEGIHHGTYRENRFWWNSRGYTPAGVEAWNCIRALDYLETRPEVDASRFGVTGRSGGGAYSWWIAALDERIKCAVPVAGISSLRDHVVEGCVEGHCDCMFMVNTYRWDFGKVAALIAPRPLLISNTDKDRLFSLEGVVDVHHQVRHIYRLHGESANLGLQITEGAHKDTQELHIHAFRWLNRFLKQDDSMIDKVATKFFEPEQLRVFNKLPADERNTQIDKHFVSLAPLPSSETVLAAQEAWFEENLSKLRDQCFRAWPDHDAAWKASPSVRIESMPFTDTAVSSESKQKRSRIHFNSDEKLGMFVDVIHNESTSLESLKSAMLVITDKPELAISTRLQDESKASHAVFVFAPRGLEPDAWVGNDAKQIQIKRRFQLIGTTADSMRIWDIRRAMQVIRETCPNVGGSIAIEGESPFEMLALIASLFEPAVATQQLSVTVTADEAMPSVLNLTRTISPDELVALAAWRCDVRMEAVSADVVPFAAGLVKASDWRGKSIRSGSLSSTR